MSNTANAMQIAATNESIKFGPQVGEWYLFRTLSLYWKGQVLGVDSEWVLLAPGSVSVVLSVGGDLDEVHTRGVVDGRKSPTWCQLNRSGILEFAPIAPGDSVAS